MISQVPSVIHDHELGGSALLRTQSGGCAVGAWFPVPRDFSSGILRGRPRSKLALDGLRGEAEARETAGVPPDAKPGLSWQEREPESSLRLCLGMGRRAPHSVSPCCGGSEKPGPCRRAGQRWVVSAGRADTRKRTSRPALRTAFRAHKHLILPPLPRSDCVSSFSLYR